MNSTLKCIAANLRILPDLGPQPRHTRLTPTEQRTQLSLWTMARSPLIVGGNLRIDQTATASRQVLHDGDLVVWTADLPENRHALAAFNLGEKPMTADRLLTNLGLREDHYNAKNAWTGERLHMSSRLRATLEPHASTVLILDGK